MPAELQTILIIVSIAVIIASLIFACYIFITNDKSGKSSPPTEKNNIMSITGTDKPTSAETSSAVMSTHDSVKTPAIIANDKVDSLRITDLKIRPPVSQPGEKILISFNATNMDRSRTDHVITLTIDGRMFASSEVRILQGLSLHLDFQVSLLKLGTHTAEINGVTRLFNIEA